MSEMLLWMCDYSGLVSFDLVEETLNYRHARHLLKSVGTNFICSSMWMVQQYILVRLCSPLAASSSWRRSIK